MNIRNRVTAYYWSNEWNIRGRENPDRDGNYPGGARFNLRKGD